MNERSPSVPDVDIHELNRRLALAPGRAREIYRQWYEEQLAQNRSREAIHFAMTLNTIIQTVAADAPAQSHLILLVHGIRTQAEWQAMVCRVLARDGTVVIPLKYGFFDVIRFWCPFITRQLAMAQILWRMRDARAQHPNSVLTIIAHSFGTYAVVNLLTKNGDIRCKRLLLCGGILRRNYRWDLMPNRPAEVLNECGSKDIYPILAQCLSWGYEASGVFGFGSPGVHDRFHNITHSDYLREEFVSKFWKPWIENGVLVPSAHEHSQPPIAWWRSVLAILPLRWPFLLLIVAAPFLVYLMVVWMRRLIGW